MNLTKNFTEDEFKCPCCGKCEMDSAFMDKLQRFRDELGVAFSPVKGGGYRCKEYLKGSKSAHGEGKACDPDFSRDLYHRALGIAFKLRFKGIGLKQKGGKFQMHLDDARNISGARPRPWVWTY